MSEDALNSAIAAKWEAAGLDASHDEVEVQSEPDVEPVDDVTDDTPADDTPVDDDTPADDAVADDDATATADDTNEEPADDDAAAAATTEEEQKEAEDDLAAALGLGKPPEDPKQRAKWWKRQLPYSLVHKTVTEREKKLRETHDGALKEHKEFRTTAETRFADVKKVEQLIETNPEHYIRTLAAIYPDTYGKMFAQLIGGKVEELPKEADLGPMPEPDVDLGDGHKTYSLEGLRKLREWDAAQLEQKMLKQFKPQLDAITKERDEAKKLRDSEARRIQGAQTADAVVAQIKKMDLGEENIDAILAEAAKLPAEYDALTAMLLSYNTVVLPKLKADRDKMRQDILAEQKKAASKKTAITIATGQTARTKEKPDESKLDLDTRIKNAWKRKGLI